jgi:hypothetical protein
MISAGSKDAGGGLSKISDRTAQIRTSPAYLTVSCPTCGALRDRPCHNASGVSIVNVHYMRAEKWGKQKQDRGY